MARLLEDVETGTPVYLGDVRIGDVRGVYAEGTSRVAEYLSIYWTARAGEVLIPTRDVASLEEKGVILMGDDARLFADMPTFDEARYPTIRKMK